MKISNECGAPANKSSRKEEILLDLVKEIREINDFFNTWFTSIPYFDIKDLQFLERFHDSENES